MVYNQAKTWLRMESRETTIAVRIVDGNVVVVGVERLPTEVEIVFARIGNIISVTTKIGAYGIHREGALLTISWKIGGNYEPLKQFVRTSLQSCDCQLTSP